MLIVLHYRSEGWSGSKRVLAVVVFHTWIPVQALIHLFVKARLSICSCKSCQVLNWVRWHSFESGLF